jgi:hypothetical protein
MAARSVGRLLRKRAVDVRGDLIAAPAKHVEHEEIDQPAISVEQRQRRARERAE